MIRYYLWPAFFATVGLALFGMALGTAATSDARPTCNPYNIQNSGGGGAFGGFGEFCDEFPISGTDVHFHCEYGGFIGYGGGCSWRNSANEVVAPPAHR